MAKMKGKIDLFEDIFISFMVATTVLVLFIQIVARYVFNNPFAWTEELARFSFIWMIYLSSSVAVREGSHIRVTAQFLLIPRRMRKYSFVIADSIWVFVSVIIIIEGFKLVGQMTEFPFMSAVLHVNLAWIYLIVPLTFALHLLRLVEIYYQFFRNGKMIPGMEELHVQ